MQIRVVTLADCHKCSGFKKALTEARIRFDFITCEDHGETCDGLESLVGVCSYPMTLVMSSKNEIMEILFLADTHKQLEEGIKTEGGIARIPLYSIDKMLSYIQNKLNLNK